MYPSTPSTPGNRIRSLRHERGLSIEALAAMAEITAVSLSNIELKSAIPQRLNLIKLLDALDDIFLIPMGGRQKILYGYGYLDSTQLPSKEEIERAIDFWREPFKKAPFPSYLIDHSQRIHDWGDQALLLTGEKKEDVAGLTFFDLLFSQKGRGKLKLLNEEELVIFDVTYIWHKLRPHLDKDWCMKCLAEAREKYPLFGELYDSVSDGSAPVIDIHSMEEAIFSDQEGNILRFGVVVASVAIDSRFQIIQYLPMDEPTVRLMAEVLASSRS